LHISEVPVKACPGFGEHVPYVTAGPEAFHGARRDHVADRTDQKIAAQRQHLIPGQGDDLVARIELDRRPGRQIPIRTASGGDPEDPALAPGLDREAPCLVGDRLADVAMYLAVPIKLIDPDPGSTYGTGDDHLSPERALGTVWLQAAARSHDHQEHRDERAMRKPAVDAIDGTRSSQRLLHGSSPVRAANH
jgi:hypothetical protein